MTMEKAVSAKTKGIDLAHRWIMYVDTMSNSPPPSPPPAAVPANIGGQQQQQQQMKEGLLQEPESSSIVSQFDTIKGFWSHFNHMNYVFARLPSSANLRLFKDYVGTVWRQQDFNGGKWIVELVDKSYADVWLNFAVALVGEAFEGSKSVIGMSLIARDLQLEVWTTENSRSMGMELFIKSILGYAESIRVEFVELNGSALVSEVEREESDVVLHYDPSFLRKISISEYAYAFPQEFENFDWETLKKDCDRIASNALLRSTERRASWPNVVEPPANWRSTKRASLDGETLFSQLSGLYRSKDLGYSSFAKFSSPLTKIWENNAESDMNSEAKDDSQNYLVSFEDSFNIDITSVLNETEIGILNHERCPICFEGSFDSHPGTYAILTCKLLQCVHIVHMDCVNKCKDRLKDLILKDHSSGFLRCLPWNTSANDFSFIPKDPPGSRLQCGVNLRICHLLGTASVLNVEWPHTISTLVDHKNGKEYLLLSLDQRLNSFLRVLRGRIYFSCTDYVTKEVWEHTSNFDLSTCAADNAKLVFVDPTTQNSLELGISKANPKGLYRIAELKYVLTSTNAQFKNTYSAIVSKPKTEQMHPSHLSSYPFVQSVEDQQYVFNFNAPGHHQGYSHDSVASPWGSRSLYQYEFKANTPLEEEVKRDADYVQDQFVYDPSNPPTIQSLIGKFVSIAKTQSGSRFIQERLPELHQSDFDLLMNDLLSSVADLMMDNFGHYAVQKLVEFSDSQRVMQILQSISPFLTNIACHKQGSFSLQSVMDCVSEQGHVEVLIDALQKNLNRIITSASGHYVVLKFLQRYHFPYTRFIHECIERNCVALSCDHYGLRVIKATIDAGPIAELTGIFKKVSRSTMKIVENQYGNYVVQQVLDVAPQSVCNVIKMKMEGKYVRLAKQKFSSNVVEKCLQSSSVEWKTIIIRELSAAASKLIRDRYGNYVLQTALSVADAPLAREMSEALIPHLGTLRENVKQKWMTILESSAQKYGVDAPRFA